MKIKIKKFMKKYYIRIVFMLILLLQILTILYATNKRERLHIDEYLSYGFISSKDMLIYNKEDFENISHTSEYFNEFLTVNDNEKYDFSPVYENQAKDVHPPFYYLLLRIFSNFNNENFSMWTGIILNIILFIISMCVLYLICMKIFNNKYYALLVCFAAGFTFGVIQMATFIRMYYLLILFTLLIVYWHLSNKDKKDLKFIDLFQLSLIIICGFLTHYYFSIIVVILFVVNFFKNLKNKNFKILLKYSSVMIVSLVAITIIFPSWISHIFYGYRGVESIGRFLNIKNTIIDKFFLFLNRLDYFGFNKYLYILFLFVLIFMISAIYLKLKNHQKFEKSNSGIAYVICPAVVYFLITLSTSPYIELRYFSPVLILIVISIIYYLKKFGEIIFQNKTYLYVLLTIIFMFISILNIFNYNHTAISFENEKEIIDCIKKNASNQSLIYIYQPECMEMYNAYILFLNHKNTLFINYNDNFIEKLHEIIKEKCYNNEEYIIGIDLNIYEDVYQKILNDKGFKDFEIYDKIGKTALIKISVIL